jgi:hypothetical protein
MVATSKPNRIMGFRVTPSEGSAQMYGKAPLATVVI